MATHEKNEDTKSTYQTAAILSGLGANLFLAATVAFAIYEVRRTTIQWTVRRRLCEAIMVKERRYPLRDRPNPRRIWSS